jgi:hypothetical protein
MALNVSLGIQFDGEGVQEKGGEFKKNKAHTTDEINLSISEIGSKI